MGTVSDRKGKGWGHCVRYRRGSVGGAVSDIEEEGYGGTVSDMKGEGLGHYVRYGRGRGLGALCQIWKGCDEEKHL